MKNLLKIYRYFYGIIIGNSTFDIKNNKFKYLKYYLKISIIKQLNEYKILLSLCVTLSTFWILL
jgi:hypothetical protein